MGKLYISDNSNAVLYIWLVKSTPFWDNWFIIGINGKCAFILYTFNYYINMVYFYYSKFKVVSSSKDALIVNNMYGHSEHYEVSC